MKQSLAFLTFILITMACKPPGIDIVIRNRSEDPIDSIRVFTSSKASETLFLRVEGGETKSQFLDMSNEPAADGNYVVTYRHGSSTFFEPVSYFTNGTPLEEKLMIVVAPNGIRLER